MLNARNKPKDWCKRCVRSEYRAVKVIRSGVIGSLIGGFVAIFIVWLYVLSPPNIDFGFFLKHLVVLAGTVGAGFGAVVGLAIGVVQVISDRSDRTE